MDPSGNYNDNSKDSPKNVVRSGARRSVQKNRTGSRTVYSSSASTSGSSSSTSANDASLKKDETSLLAAKSAMLNRHRPIKTSSGAAAAKDTPSLLSGSRHEDYEEDLLAAKSNVASRRLVVAAASSSSNKKKSAFDQPPADPTETSTSAEEGEEGPVVPKTSLMRGSSAPRSQPGSFAVSSGISSSTRGFIVHNDTVIPTVDDESEEDLEATSPQQEPDTHIVAELVDPRLEQERLETERERIRKETVKEIEANVPQAEIFDDTEDRRKRRRVRIVLTAVTLISVVVAVVLGIVLSQKDDKVLTRIEEVENALQGSYGGDTDFSEDDEYAQSQAFDWMVNSDNTTVFPLTTEDEAVAFLERWAMCVLAFAMDLENWENGERWLNTTLPTCDWSGLTCDRRGRLIGINLGKYVVEHWKG